MFAHIEYCTEDKAEVLCISPCVLNIWRNHRQTKKNDHEAFGVLVGSQALDSSRLWVDECTTPSRIDRSTRSSFKLIDPYHQRMVNHYYKESNGQSGYVGTWHTHPEETPAPSAIDIKDWHECISRNLDRILIFVIVGLSHFCVYRMSNVTFERTIMEHL